MVPSIEAQGGSQDKIRSYIQINFSSNFSCAVTVHSKENLQNAVVEWRGELLLKSMDINNAKWCRLEEIMNWT